MEARPAGAGSATRVTGSATAPAGRHAGHGLHGREPRFDRTDDGGQTTAGDRAGPCQSDHPATVACEGRRFSSTFVTVFEPVGQSVSRPCAGLAGSPRIADVVVVLVETADGPEYVLVNLNPGSTRRVALPGGRYVSFDGVAVRVREAELVLAGGTFAEGAGKLVSQASLAGTLTASVRRTDRARARLVRHHRPPARRSGARGPNPHRRAW